MKHPMIGKQLGHYQITQQIGTGGLGEVYRATDTKLNRDVALKILGQPDDSVDDVASLLKDRGSLPTLAGSWCESWTNGPV